MESYAKPLRELDEDATWFARATELRLLHVTCSSELRGPALQVLGAMEAHRDNRSPVIALEDAWTTADPGWKVRAQRMVEAWQGRVRVSAEAGIELGSLGGTRPASPDAFGAFGGWVNLLLQAVRSPLEGLVLILAPTRIEQPSAFESELLQLIQSPELQGARWVVLDAENCALERLHAELAGLAMRAVCQLDPEAFSRDLDTMMQSMDPSALGPARAGAAWPRGVTPPPRPGTRAPTEEELGEVDIELAVAGANPTLAGEAGTRMQQYMLAAAVAARRGEMDKAVGMQAEACRIAYDAGAQREAIIQHLVVAGYKLAAGQDAEAYADYASAAERAEEWDLPLEHAQACLSLGLLNARSGRHADAAAWYGNGARSAGKADAAGLAIECWRLAGQMAAEAGLDERASECFHHAIELAEGAEPEVTKRSSAPLAARQLAARLRARGLDTHADSLEHTANRLEEGIPRSVEELY